MFSGHCRLPDYGRPSGGKTRRLLGGLPLSWCAEIRPKGWISGIAFTWGELYTRFARAVMDGTWKSEGLFGNLTSDYLTIAPFGRRFRPMR